MVRATTWRAGWVAAAMALLAGLAAEGCGGDDGAGGATGDDGGGAAADGGRGDAGESGDDASTGDASPRGDAGQGGGGGVTGVDVSSDVSKLDHELATAVCARIASCCSGADADAFFQQFETKPYTLTGTPAPAECATKLAEQLAIVHGKWAAAVKRGTMAFDLPRGEGCVAAVSGAACGLPLATSLYDQACFGLRGNEIFRKTAPLGAACQDIGDGTFFGECDPAFGYCDGARCVAWKKTGEECQLKPREFCAPDLSCDGQTPTSAGKCSAAPKTVKLGDTCDTQTGAILYCPTNAYCDFAGGGTCVAKKSDGTACTFDEECQTAHPFTCWGGTCGSTAYCNGKGSAVDGGADGGDAGHGGDDGGLQDGGDAGADAHLSDAADDAAPVDAGQDAGATVDAAAASFTIERTDDPTSIAAASITAMQRDRVTLRWSAPGATSVAIDGAGLALARVTDGTPTWDDMSGASDLAEEVPTQSSGVWGFREVIAATMPFPATILGETWKNGIAISPRGVVTRGTASALNDVNAALPVPQRGVFTDWSDGTIAPFWDRHLDANAQGTSRIRHGDFGSGADRRFVVEWSKMTTRGPSGANVAGEISFELALYADGRVELRYAPFAAAPNAATALLDAALAAGQGATIGLAQSTDGGPPWALPLSVRRPSIPATGVTYTVYAASALPPSGRAIALLPASAGAVTFTRRAAGLPDATVTATVEPAYALTKTTGAIRDLSAVAGAQTLSFASGDTVVPLAVPFAVDVFREGWRTLGVSRSGAVAPWGVAGLDFGLNYKSIPDGLYPNGFVAALYPVNGASWCAAGQLPTVTAAIEGAAPSRTVTLLYKGIGKCGASNGAIDVEVVLHENGDVEMVYGNETSTAAEITGQGTLSGLENGNGDVGLIAVKDTAGAITPGTRFVLTRHR